MACLFVTKNRQNFEFKKEGSLLQKVRKQGDIDSGCLGKAY